MANDRVESRDLETGVRFLFQTTLGILGNLSLLSFYLLLYYKEYPPKPIHLIFKHLLMANSLFILSNGVPHTMSALGMKQLFSDLGCKLLLYVQRVGRSMSIGCTCLLSVFQAITISPRNSCWKDLKDKVPNNIGLSIYLTWVLYVGVNFIFPVYGYTKRNIENMTVKRDYQYCSTTAHDKTTALLYIAFLVFPGVLFSLLLLWSSGSVVFTLFRHKQRVQHIRSTHLSARAGPETRATRSILVLMSSFVAFYTLSSVLYGCNALLNNPSKWLLRLTEFISMSFSTFSPFIISRDSTVPRFCFVLTRNPKSHYTLSM